MAALAISWRFWVVLLVLFLLVLLRRLYHQWQLGRRDRERERDR